MSEETPKVVKTAKDLPVLTEEQKDFIRLNWTMDLKELTRLVFKNPDLDGRSIEHRAIKIHIASLDKAQMQSPDTPKIESLLTDPQKEYIKNNLSSSSDLEMARLLFGNSTLLAASPECRMVTAYCRVINPSYRKNEEFVENEYEVPKNIEELAKRVNKYVTNPRGDGKPIYNIESLTNNDKKQLHTLLANMRKPLFKTEVVEYERKNDVELYESTFILMCWDKPDLLAEEVMQYIALASETVKYAQIERTVKKLDARLYAILETDGQIKVSEVELLNSVREKSNASMKQSASLLKALIGDRAKRLNDKIQSNASLHNLVEAWKREDDRRKILEMNQKKEKAALKIELDRLDDMDALKAQIFGLDKDNILR